MARIVPEGGWESRLKPFKTPREEKPAHLAFLRKLICPCCATGDAKGSFFASDIQAAHLRAGSALHGKEPLPGMQQKPDDRWALPLCQAHHAEQHTMDEMEFWRSFGIDPHVLALVLWGLTGKVHEATWVVTAHANAGAYVRAVTANRDAQEA